MKKHLLFLSTILSCAGSSYERALTVEGGAGTIVVAEYIRSKSTFGTEKHETTVGAEVAVTDSSGRVQLHEPSRANMTLLTIARPGFQTWWGPETQNKAGPTRISDQGAIQLAPAVSFGEAQSAAWELGHRVDSTCELVPEDQAQRLRLWHEDNVKQLKSRFDYAFDPVAAITPRSAGELTLRVGSWAAAQGRGDGRISSGITDTLLLPGGELVLADGLDSSIWVISAEGGILASRSVDSSLSTLLSKAPGGQIAALEGDKIVLYEQDLAPVREILLQPPPSGFTSSLQMLDDGRALVGVIYDEGPDAVRFYSPSGILLEERKITELQDLWQVAMLPSGRLVIAGDQRDGSASRELVLEGKTWSHGDNTSRVLALDPPVQLASGVSSFAISGEEITVLQSDLVTLAEQEALYHYQSELDRTEIRREALVTLSPSGEIISSRMLQARELGPLKARSLDIVGDRVLIFNQEVAGSDIVETKTPVLKSH